MADQSVQNKIIYNPDCWKCRYRSSKPGENGCDYNYLTGKMRGCLVIGCTRFEPGERLVDRNKTRPPAPLRRPEKEEEIGGYLAERNRRVAGIDCAQLRFRDK